MQLISEKSISTTAPETITLDVTGMKCAGCVKAVENQLTRQPGVLSACVNLVTEVAVVECQLGSVNPERLAGTLTDAGFPPNPDIPMAVRQGLEMRRLELLTCQSDDGWNRDSKPDDWRSQPYFSCSQHWGTSTSWLVSVFPGSAIFGFTAG